MGVKVKFHKGAWWVFVAFQRRRRAKKIGDQESANRIAQQIRERLAAGVFRLKAPGPDESVETFGRTWLTGLNGNLKASTVRFYRENLERYVFPIIGSRPIRVVSRADCREVIATARAKGLKLNTVKGIART